MGLKIAGSMAFKEAASRARPVLLEPIMDIEVVTPTEYMGEVLGDLNSRRGKIGCMTQRGAGGDVWLLHRVALGDAGARGVHHAVLALRGSAQGEGRRDREQTEGLRDPTPH